MAAQLSQDYTVDSRYAAGKGALDNERGKSFLQQFINMRKSAGEMTNDLQPEDRFIMSGPGDTTYGFRNAFRASK
jgi:hypothetical protein